MWCFTIIYSIVQAVISAEAFSGSQPIWNKEYIVNGTLRIPYAEIEEPFHAWYDSLSGRSRIDYYGGMVKTYQLVHDTQYGSLYQIVPVTDTEFLNKQTCFEENGNEDTPINIQSVLPDTKNFRLVGTEILKGQKCDRFVFEETIEQKRNTYTLWIRSKDAPCPSAKGISIPVRYEMRGYDTLLSSHYDYYYLDYDSYVVGDIPDDVFKIDPACYDENDLHKGIHSTFNPMQEFIHPTVTDHVDSEFAIFKDKHQKAYEHEAEEHVRKNVFRQNLRLINSKNRAGLGFALSINHLADKTDDELTTLLGARPSKSNRPFFKKLFFNDTDQLSPDLPVQFDWRLYGAVSPVKDQAICGSCWAFAAIGSVEGAYFLKTKNLIRFSEQALVDCSWGFGNSGCDGGFETAAYDWMLKSGGIPTENDYGPYLGVDGYCHAKNVSITIPIKDYRLFHPQNPKELKIALLKYGPLAVAVDGSPKEFAFYSHGVYEHPNSEININHAVLLVGYGYIDGKYYWLVKNSWSSHWGNNGYVLISAENDKSGVMYSPSYVIM